MRDNESIFTFKQEQAIELAEGVLSLANRVVDLTEQVKQLEWYKEQYVNLLNNDIKQSGEMTAMILKLALNGNLVGSEAQRGDT